MAFLALAIVISVERRTMSMKIVKIQHDRLTNATAKEFLFQTPADLKRGQMVLVDTVHGFAIGWVSADSIIAQDKTVAYICDNGDGRPYQPLKKVLGVIDVFEGDNDDE